MTVHTTPWEVASPPVRATVEASFADGGLTARGWGDSPGDVDLGPGDRLDVEPGTEHAASVGDGGVQCPEASR